MRRGLVFDIRRYSVHDGPGIRTTVFFKGCPLSCWWCHNPESQGRAPFLHYDPERCLRCGTCVATCSRGALTMTPTGVVVDDDLCLLDGACVRACPAEAREMVGQYWTVPELVAEIEKDRLFHDQSRGGVTFSGGEPLLQWAFLVDVLRECGARRIHRTVDTSGFASPRVLLEVAAETDLFLYDIKTLDARLHRRFTGVPLQPILENLERLLERGSHVRVRLPLIPGINDTPDHVRQVGDFLVDHPGIQEVHLLPFHRPARSKHERFGMAWRLEVDHAIADERIAELSGVLQDRGLNVTIGG